jgi:hypothetical protein
MAHNPGNTAASWRRQFYADLLHGVTTFNLFHFLPSFSAPTGSYVDIEGNGAAHYREVRSAFSELGIFEDVVQDGAVFRPPAMARIGLLYSESADIWAGMAGTVTPGPYCHLLYPL